jgi:hypothetical protein
MSSYASCVDQAGRHAGLSDPGLGHNPGHRARRKVFCPLCDRAPLAEAMIKALIRHLRVNIQYYGASSH